MADSPRSSVVLDDFPGLVENVAPEDLPEGAALVQVNAASLTVGELVTRGGYRQVSFEAG